MRFAIKNLKKNSHTICRTTGQSLTIEGKSFIIFDTDNQREVDYWTNLNKDVQKRCGIEVVTDEKTIHFLEKQIKKKPNIAPKEELEYTDLSILDNSVSPIAQQIVEEHGVGPKNTKPETESNNSYTKENLSKLAKEDLLNICENFGIKYRRNSSVKTLVDLILGSDKI